MTDIKKTAAELAAKANRCCYRSDGYEEDMKAAILEALNAAIKEALEAACKRVQEDLFRLDIPGGQHRWTTHYSEIVESIMREGR